MNKGLPVWFKQKLPRAIEAVNSRIDEFKALGLNTVCQSARCPNLNSCFSNNSVTFMIMGKNCTRNCGFCAVGKAAVRALDLCESYNIALSIRGQGIKYAVITSVTRDDLPYGGATQFARTTYLIRSLDKSIKIELLIPDFLGRDYPLKIIIKSSPDVISHNIETVERLYRGVRPQGSYRRALDVIRKIKNLGFEHFTKSGIMLGFGETEEEVLETMRDLRAAGCDMLTLGQYLAPSKKHYPVREFIHPDKFTFYRDKAYSLGFKGVDSGPLVRSSYMAAERYSQLVALKSEG